MAVIVLLVMEKMEGMEDAIRKENKLLRQEIHEKFRKFGLKGR